MFLLKTTTGVITLKPRDHWMTITKGMSGHFAVEMWVNPDMDSFPEPWDTGIGRYATKEEAYEEAKFMAAEAGLPLEVLS